MPTRRHPVSDTPTRVLAVLVAAERQGRRLSVREIRDVCHLSSTSVVQFNMRKLAADGDIVLGAHGTSRGYTITAQGRGLPSDAELLKKCLSMLELVGGPLVEQLRERLRS